VNFRSRTSSNRFFFLKPLGPGDFLPEDGDLAPSLSLGLNLEGFGAGLAVGFAEDFVDGLPLKGFGAMAI
jgi:hypothetical protein